MMAFRCCCVASWLTAKFILAREEHQAEEKESTGHTFFLLARLAWIRSIVLMRGARFDDFLSISAASLAIAPASERTGSEGQG